jgi:molybdopterin-guanine dinucleotide biosynthesis protein A
MGLMRTESGETLVARWRALFGSLCIPAVLVGYNDVYSPLGMTMLRDEGTGLGPLGGLLALLGHAVHTDQTRVVCVACDMPYVTSRLMQRLVDAPSARAVAPWQEGRWEPFLSRFEARAALPVARSLARSGVTSLQALLAGLRAAALDLSDADREELRDWDTSYDVATERR